MKSMIYEVNLLLNATCLQHLNFCQDKSETADLFGKSTMCTIYLLLAFIGRVPP